MGQLQLMDDGCRWPGTQASRLGRLGSTCSEMTDDGRRWPGTHAHRLWQLGSTCWEMADDGRRWPGTQACRLWWLGGTCWGPGEGVGHHIVHTRDLDAYTEIYERPHYHVFSQLG